MIRRRLLLLGLLAVLAGAVAGPTLTAGPVAASALPANPWYHLDDAGELRIDLWFGWSSTRPHCARARPVVEALDRELPWLDVHSLRVDGADGEANGATPVALGELVGEEVRYVPSFPYGGRLRTGFDAADATRCCARAASRSSSPAC